MDEIKNEVESTSQPINDNENNVLDSLPQELRSQIEDIFIESTQQQQLSMLAHNGNSLVDKFTPEHIDQYLKSSDKNMEKIHEEEKGKRQTAAFLVISFLLFMLAVIFLLKDKEDLLNNLIGIIVTAIPSALGGYGIGKYQNR